VLTWAAVGLPMLQQLLDTVPLTGHEWGLVLVLSLIMPVLVFIDKTLQLRQQKKAGQQLGGPVAAPAEPAA
jgi:hypothetical protein